MSNLLRDIKPVAVLGCGPAGLLAAHAVGLSGQPMSVFSVKRQSVLGGAQFLNGPVPMITEPEADFQITYRTRGDALSYRHKVYGTDDPTTNPDFVSMSNVHDGQQVPAWDLRQAYDRLWSQFEHSINDEAVTPGWLEANASQFRTIVSTVPLPTLCRSMAGEDVGTRHSFTVQSIHVSQGDDAGAAKALDDNTVLYNGDLEQAWYRASKINGVPSVEYSDRGRLPPIPNLVGLNKPIRTTCDCWPDVLKVGRFGKWQKGVLTYDAFVETLKHFMA